MTLLQKSLFLTALFFLFPVLSCEKEKSATVLSARALTKMERSLVGDWIYSYYLEKDDLVFRNDLTFKAVRDGNNYNGNYNADNDSVLELLGTVPTSGGMTFQRMRYRIVEVNSARLRLQTGGLTITYTRN